MKRNILVFICIVFLQFALTQPIYASYVLPYPSYMPGNKIYKISRIIDIVQNWWFFGSISQIKYHLKLSDKYLIEAKTLFEYQQFLLGVDALKRSDREFSKIPTYVKNASNEGKDINEFIQTIKHASEKHKEVLSGIEKQVPDAFLWTPEKSASTELNLQKLLQDSIQVRNNIQQELK